MIQSKKIHNFLNKKIVNFDYFSTIPHMHTICDKTTAPLSVSSDKSLLPHWKRGMDIACCVVAMPLLAVCTLLMTLLTKLVSPGPVFFRQERIGFQGRRFKIYKFRTMAVSADTHVHQTYYKNLIQTNAPMAKLDSKGDKRLIPGGWLLRAAGLDELPQIINVFRGEMSLVGPRPCIPSEYEQYLPWQQERSSAMPGLTGLWQVSGKNSTTFDEMVKLDIEYSRSVSLRLDLKIIVATIPTLLTQTVETSLRRKPAVKSSSSLLGRTVSANIVSNS